MRSLGLRIYRVRYVPSSGARVQVARDEMSSVADVGARLFEALRAAGFDFYRNRFKRVSRSLTLSAGEEFEIVGITYDALSKKPQSTSGAVGLLRSWPLIKSHRSC